MTGITTIRACKAQEALLSEFDSHQDLHTSAWYLTQVTGATLGFWVDLLCAAYFAIVAFSFILLYDSKFYSVSQNLPQLHQPKFF